MLIRRRLIGRARPFELYPAVLDQLHLRRPALVARLPLAVRLRARHADRLANGADQFRQQVLQLRPQSLEHLPDLLKNRVQFQQAGDLLERLGEQAGDQPTDLQGDVADNAGDVRRSHLENLGDLAQGAADQGDHAADQLNDLADAAADERRREIDDDSFYG